MDAGHIDAIELIVEYVIALNDLPYLDAIGREVRPLGIEADAVFSIAVNPIAPDLVAIRVSEKDDNAAFDERAADGIALNNGVAGLRQ